MRANLPPRSAVASHTTQGASVGPAAQPRDQPAPVGYRTLHAKATMPNAVWQRISSRTPRPSLEPRDAQGLVADFLARGAFDPGPVTGAMRA
jgi:hypothetical protein